MPSLNRRHHALSGVAVTRLATASLDVFLASEVGMDPVPKSAAQRGAAVEPVAERRGHWPCRSCRDR
jgi:hypothetical protein